MSLNRLKSDVAAEIDAFRNGTVEVSKVSVLGWASALIVLISLRPLYGPVVRAMTVNEKVTMIFIVLVVAFGSLALSSVRSNRHTTVTESGR